MSRALFLAKSQLKNTFPSVDETCRPLIIASNPPKGKKNGQGLLDRYSRPH